jgi:hypothetical protein
MEYADGWLFYSHSILLVWLRPMLLEFLGLCLPCAFAGDSRVAEVSRLGKFFWPCSVVCGAVLQYIERLPAPLVFAIDGLEIVAVLGDMHCVE